MDTEKKDIECRGMMLKCNIIPYKYIIAICCGQYKLNKIFLQRPLY